MSKPRYRWWGYIKNVIRAYPELKGKYADLHRQSITADISGIPGGGGASRTVENIAIRELPKGEQDELEAVRRTVEVTERLRTGTDRLKIISLVFWEQSHTLHGAALETHIGYDTAIGYHGDFIMMVAYFMGRIPYEELKKSQKIALKSQKPVVE